jgi:hypothetical protein
MRGHEPQNVLKLVWRVGIYLGGQAHLGEAESSQLEQRIVPRDTSLEQAMNRPEHPSVSRTLLTKTPTIWAGRIHDPHPHSDIDTPILHLLLLTVHQQHPSADPSAQHGPSDCPLLQTSDPTDRSRYSMAMERRPTSRTSPPIRQNGGPDFLSERSKRDCLVIAGKV